MPDNKTSDSVHELWLVYCQLKDAEASTTARDELLTSARSRLGRILNELNQHQLVPISPGIKAADLNCRDRKKGLTPDNSKPSWPNWVMTPFAALSWIVCLTNQLS